MKRWSNVFRDTDIIRKDVIDAFLKFSLPRFDFIGEAQGDLIYVSGEGQKPEGIYQWDPVAEKYNKIATLDDIEEIEDQIIDQFVELKDTPEDFIDNASDLLIVNEEEDAVEFIDIKDINEFQDLVDDVEFLEQFDNVFLDEKAPEIDENWDDESVLFMKLNPIKGVE